MTGRGIERVCVLGDLAGSQQLQVSVVQRVGA